MGWTKRADAIKTMKRRLGKLRSILNSASKCASSGQLYNANEQSELWRSLQEYYKLSHAMAHGRRDGVIRSELGVNPAAETLDYGPLVSSLMIQHDSFRWRRGW